MKATLRFVKRISLAMVLLAVGNEAFSQIHNSNIGLNVRSTDGLTHSNSDVVTINNNGLDPSLISEPFYLNLSRDISPDLVTNVSFTAMQRTWEVIESSNGESPEVDIQILKNAVLPASSTNGQFIMLISNTPEFDAASDHVLMKETLNEFGEPVLTTTYIFNDTKFITFGWAPELNFERSVYIDGATNYIDMGNTLNLNPSEFTVSAWIKRDVDATNSSTILSKRDSDFSTGYVLNITNTGHVQMAWIHNETNQSIISSTRLSNNKWHQVAIIYDGTKASIFIDGVLDISQNLANPENSSNSFFIGAADKNVPKDFFKGNIDEVRIWDTKLSTEQLRFMMNQEIVNNANFVNGSYFLNRNIVPTKNSVQNIDWPKLAAYYPMSKFSYIYAMDASGNENTGMLRNTSTIDQQTAPLPYQSSEIGGNWHENATWENGDVQTIPGTSSIVDNNQSIDWNIVKTASNIIILNAADLPLSNKGNRTLLALFVDNNTLTIAGDNTLQTGTGLTISHYLNLDGAIDLNGESQLIQSVGSDLEVDSSGKIEKDQQGTKDLYTYYYWSSPVGTLSTNQNNTNFIVSDILKNGTNANNPETINFLTSGYNGNTNGTNIAVADYWIWKFNNLQGDDYASWQHIRATGTIKPGEGYTMKGVEDTFNNLDVEQNYVFTGKPNNGIVELDIDSGNDYLLGNPYPSVLDANKFLNDNGPNSSDTSAAPVINGTLYYWKHWANGSHSLSNFQGSYAAYNLSGGVSAAKIDAVDQAQASSFTKIPGKYIPVSQGFFVTGNLDNSKIEFNNSQRVFKKESDNTNEDEDLRQKIRFTFNSVNTYKRQLLLTEDQNASSNYDWGYDGVLNEDLMDDMFWIIEDNRYVIQGIDALTEQTVLPIGIKTEASGENSISINALENFDSNINIYLHDKELNLYHDLKSSKYYVHLNAGEYLNRFEITFTVEDTLSLTNNILEDFDVNYTNSIESIVISNPKLQEIMAVKLLSILGQEVYTTNTILTKNNIALKVSDLSAGTYIINIKTRDHRTITKKVLVK